MIDVVIWANLNELDFSKEALVKFNNCKKSLCKSIKDNLNSNDISNKFISFYNESGLEEIKCFLNIELKLGEEDGIEIFSPKVVNKSYELANNLVECFDNEDIVSYENIDFLGNNLPYAVAKIKINLYLTEDNLDYESYLKFIAKIISLGLGKYLGITMDVLENNNDINLINDKVIDKNQAKQFSINMGLEDKIIELIDYYWELSKDYGQVDPLIAYIQAIITISQNKVDYNYYNPGGIKEAQLNSIGIYEYKKFKTIRAGIAAQLDHLALFAGAEGYPRNETEDPRHFKYLLGSCKTVESLSGKWDLDKEYGSRVSKLYYEINKVKEFATFKELNIDNIGVVNHINSFNEKLMAMGVLLEDIFKEYSNLYKELEEFKKEVFLLEEDKKKIESEKNQLEKKVVKQKEVIKDILNVIGGSLEKK